MSDYNNRPKKRLKVAEIEKDEAHEIEIGKAKIPGQKGKVEIFLSAKIKGKPILLRKNDLDNTNITIKVRGAVQKMKTNTANVRVEGDCKEVKTNTGNVTVSGNCNGTVKSNTGKITVHGNVSRMKGGNISCNFS